MSDERMGSRLTALVRMLAPKGKQQVSAKVLNTWIVRAEGKIGDEARHDDKPQTLTTMP